MLRIGVIADDLTGATTVGALLARSGVRTHVFFCEETEINKAETEQLEAVVISTDSRALPAERAQKRVRSAMQALKKLGVSYYHKRIDTTMRGSIGAEIDAMLGELPEDTTAVVVPSMPQSNRILVGGYSIIDGVPLDRTSAAYDVRTPVRESYIPRLLAGQTRHKVGIVTLHDVGSSAEAVQASLKRKKESGCKIIVADAVTEEDIVSIARACVLLGWNILTVDPGPFTVEMARQCGEAGMENEIVVSKVSAPEEKGSENGKEEKVSKARTVLIAAGSAADVTKKQMEIFCQDDRHIRVSVTARKLLEGDAAAKREVERAAGAALSLLNSPDPVRAVLIETALHGERLDLDAEDARCRCRAGRSAELINEGLGKIVRKVLEEAEKDKIAGLYLTGGDTTAHVLRSLGAKCVEVIGYVIPQADIVRIAGGCYSGMPVIAKGGMTGSDGIVEDIVARLFAETAESS